MKKAQRPGFVLYFDDFRVLDKNLSPLEFKRVVFAALEYAETGRVRNDLTQIESVCFGFIRGKIDKDAEKYADTCTQNAYNAYVGRCKSSGEAPQTREEWERERALPSAAERGRALPGICDY